MSSTRLACALSAPLALLAPAAPSGAAHVPGRPFSVSCSGHASVHVAGRTGAASAAGTCRGTPIGRGAFSASADARIVDAHCAAYAGRGEISARHGRIRLTGLPNARACAAGRADLRSVSFSGRARIVGGTGRFRLARGAVAYSGRYDGGTGKIAISLHGRLTTG